MTRSTTWMTTNPLSWVWLLLLLHVLPMTTVLVVVVGQTECTLCFGGDEANLTKTVGGASDGVPCSLLITDVNINEEDCRDLQLLGYRYCDCPSYPAEYFCPMCPNAATDIPNRFQLIPGTDDTCDDQLFVSIDEVDSCDDAMKPGFVCGCPGAIKPDCMICGGTSNDISNVSDERLTIESVGSFTCEEFANQAVLGDLTVEQCALVTEEATSFCCPSPEEEEEDTTTTPSPDDTNDTTGTEAEATTRPEESDSATITDDSGAAFGGRNMQSAITRLLVGLFLVLWISL